MKKLRLLTKSLLVAAGLCVGASAWATDYTETYDFNTYAKNNGAVSSTSIGSCVVETSETSTNATLSSVTYIYNSSTSAVLKQVNGRIALGGDARLRTDGGAQNLGIFVNNKTTGYLAIRGLSVNDYVAITMMGPDANGKNATATISLSSGSAVWTSDNSSVSDIAHGNGAAQEMKITALNSDGNVVFKLPAYTRMKKIQILTSPDLLSAPTVEATSADGLRPAVTNGVSCSEVATVTSYWNTTNSNVNGTAWNAEAGLPSAGTYYFYSVSNKGGVSATTEYEASSEVALAPTFSLTAINGTSRTYRISFSEGETLHYAFSADGEPASGDYSTTSEGTYYDYTGSTTGTIYAYTTLGGASSAVVTQELEATEVQLSAPTFARGAYSNGYYSISIASDQSLVQLQPTVILKYRIGESGEFQDYSSAVDVPEGSTLYAYAYNSNYTNSETKDIVTGNRTAISSGNWIAETLIDFENRSGNTLSLSEEGTFEVNGTTYKPAILNSTLHERFGLTSTNNILLSSNSSTYEGLYPWNATINAGIKGLKKGQYVKIRVSNLSSLGGISSNLTLCDEFSSNKERFYRVNADGNASFTYSKASYVYLLSVTVYRDDVTATIGSTGYATFSSTYALDFTDVTEATAYIATNKSGDNIQMQSITGTVAAGTGLVLKSANGGSASISIPVVASGTTYNTTTDPTNYLFAIDNDYNLTASDNGTNYVLSVQSGKVVFAPVSSTAAPVKAGHAALWIPTAVAQQARALVMSFSDESTGIGQLESVRQSTDNTVYNLNGQRVAQPSKGLYIVDGKKVVVK